MKVFKLVLAMFPLKVCEYVTTNEKVCKNLIFMNENWLNDLIIDCKPPSNLVELIENNLDFEELEKFEGYFEQDELLDI
jgi:hypothetical protein